MVCFTAHNINNDLFRPWAATTGILRRIEISYGSSNTRLTGVSIERAQSELSALALGATIIPRRTPAEGRNRSLSRILGLRNRTGIFAAVASCLR